MKLFIIIGMLAFSSVSFAGARRIYCEGNIVKMDEWAKGARPMGDTIQIRGLEKEISAKKVYFFDDNDSYDFLIVYQSGEPGTDVDAILHTEGEKIHFSVAKNGVILEEVECLLGF